MVLKKLVSIFSVFAVSGLFCFASAKQNVGAQPLDNDAALKGKKILVVYYSKTGNTKKIGSELAKILGADEEMIIDKADRSGVSGYVKGGRDAVRKKETEIEPIKAVVKDYDLVVIGTPVWGWNMTPAVRAFISQKKDEIKNVAFFTTAGGTKPEKVVPSMEEAAGKKAVAYAGFFEKDIKKANYAGKMNTFVEQLMTTLK